MELKGLIPALLILFAGIHAELTKYKPKLVLQIEPGGTCNTCNEGEKFELTHDMCFNACRAIKSTYIKKKGDCASYRITEITKDGTLDTYIINAAACGGKPRYVYVQQVKDENNEDIYNAYHTKDSNSSESLED